MARELRGWLIVEFFHIITAKATVHNEKRLSFVHKRYHHNFVFFGIWELQRIFCCLDIVWKYFKLRDTSLPSCWCYAFYELIFYLHVEPLSCPYSQINTNPGVESYVIFTNVSDKICDISDFFVFKPIEYVLIIVVAFPTLVYNSLDWGFGSCQIFYSSKVYF